MAKFVTLQRQSGVYAYFQQVIFNTMQLIRFADTDTLSLRQVDELNNVPKGTSFRVFRRCEAQLEEGRDFFYLAADEHKVLIDSLKASGQIYATTVNLVLLTRVGYQRMQQLATALPGGGR